jgi:hypothetical protein
MRMYSKTMVEVEFRGKKTGSSSILTEDMDVLFPVEQYILKIGVAPSWIELSAE